MALRSIEALPYASLVTRPDIVEMPQVIEARDAGFAAAIRLDAARPANTVRQIERFFIAGVEHARRAGPIPCADRNGLADDARVAERS